MQYGKILTRAWEITWRYKYLWILGFLAGEAAGGGGGGSGVNYQFNNRDVPNMRVPPEVSGLLVGLGCLAFLVGIVLWVLSVMARGGLIAAVDEIEKGGRLTLGEAFRAGARRFWTLFGIGVLAALPLLLLFLALAVVALLAFATLTSVNSGGDFRGGGWLLLAACIIPLVCVVFLLSIVLNQVRLYGERAAMLEGLGWIDAFRRGWRVLRTHLGPTIILWLVFLVIGLVFGAIALAGFMAVIAPVLFTAGITNGREWTLIPLCGGGLLLFLVLAFVSSILGTFTSAVWTLAYRALVGPRGEGSGATTFPAPEPPGAAMFPEPEPPGARTYPAPEPPAA